MSFLIDEFRGTNFFLSNFCPCKLSYEGMTYWSTEAAFQAAKTNDASMKREISEVNDPGRAKQLGRRVLLREDWEEIKLKVMEDILRIKFSQPRFKSMLLETWPKDLIEGNNWNDRYWGICAGGGQNHLGRILMKIREELHA